jgi:hypothetical protein
VKQTGTRDAEKRLLFKRWAQKMSSTSFEPVNPNHYSLI